MARASKETRDANRERLLNAAEKVFLELGYSAATVEQIAAAASLTTGAVYSNFSGKSQLFAAVVARQSAQDRAAIVELVDQHETLQAKARAVGEREASIAAETGAWTQLLWECRLQALRRPELRAASTDADLPRAKAIGALVEAGLRGARKMSPAPPNQLGIMFLALVNGLAFYRLSHPSDVPDELFPLALEVLTRGLEEVGTRAPNDRSES